MGEELMRTLFLCIGSQSCQVLGLLPLLLLLFLPLLLLFDLLLEFLLLAATAVQGSSKLAGILVQTHAFEFTQFERRIRCLESSQA